MANFFKGLWGLAKHPLDEAEFMVKGARDVVKGDRSVGDLFGDHQDMMSENITVPLGGRNKLTENSDAVAGAVVGGVLAAPALMSAGSSLGSSVASSTGKLGGSDFARMGMNAIRSDPTFDFRGTAGGSDASTYFQPGVTKTQAANLSAVGSPLAKSTTGGMFDTMKQGVSDAGDYIGSKAKTLVPGRGVKDGSEIFGKIDEFTNPELLNKIREQGSFGFQGAQDPGAFDGYFKTGEVDRLKQYQNIGATDWKEDGGSGWGAGSMPEKGMDWRTSDQIRDYEEKTNFIPDSYEAAKEEWGEGFDWEKLARTLQSIKSPGNESLPSSSGRVGGRFNFDKSLYENPLLTRELQALYQAPLYNKLY